MSDDKTMFALACRDVEAPAPVLTGVQATGRLDGVLFELALRQTYRNRSDRTLEVVYTFPLPQQAVLLGFASELNGARQEGTMVARVAAERQYERALSEGDAPVMLEAVGDGLHTANIGNLKPGDELVLEVCYAQLLAFEQGRLRLAIPTTIAPRYGSAERGGLQPQQVPQASLDAEYPLAISLTVAGTLAGAAVTTPTHRFTQAQVEGGVRLDLDRGAWLDRDVVVLVEPREALPSLVIQAHDAVNPAAPVVVMAALQPPAAAKRERIALKLLVDCSGSMGGDSIESARAALRGVVGELGEGDHVSLTRFGSKVDRVLAPSACTADVLHQAKTMIDAIEADLGGTEMEAALRAVFALKLPKGAGDADVLLVTDGEIWEAAAMVAAARASGHRVFAIGVGSSPAEGVLRALAEATGGACEFATPGEALEAAARRMLGRIRQQAWRDVRIEWGAETAWQTAPPVGVFGGDTLIAFAGMSSKSAASAVRLLAKDARGTTVELARGEAQAPCPGESLARIAASRRMAGANEDESLKLALGYQLMSKRTNCILVHPRAEADKATEEAELHRVNSMLAAGWGATSSVARAMPMADTVCFSMDYKPSESASSVGDIDTVYSRSMESVARRVPAAPEVPGPEFDTLRLIAQAVARNLDEGGSVKDLPTRLKAIALHPAAQAALVQAIDLGVSEGQAWLLLAHWANARIGGLGDAAIEALLQRPLASLDPGLVQRCMEVYDALLGRQSVDAWALARAQRLQRALGRTLP